MQGYTFTEIKTFKLDDYLCVRGWIGDKPQKIYSNKSCLQFYLYDETTDRLFEFQADLARFTGDVEYKKIIKEYLASHIL